MPVNTGAEFSPCRTWRYALWREWGAGPFVSFIGLNPSTADETVNDNTVSRCIKFAEYWGFNGMRMLNIFAFRATDPARMKRAKDPIGPDNDQAILRYLMDRRNRLIVACWGVHGSHMSRGWEVRKKLLEGWNLKCFGTTKAGAPKHPLYLPSDAELVEFSNREV